MPIDKTLADEQFRRYTYLRDNGHLDYVEKANKCDQYYLGNQWDPVDKAMLEHVRRPALTINKMLPTVANLQGAYINTRVDISLKGGDTAAVMEKVIRSIFYNNQYRWMEAQAFDDGLITSRGFMDVRLSFKENMRGEVEITSPNPRNVLIDCDGEEYDPDTWNDVCTSKWLSPVDIAVLYNQDDANWLRTAPPTDYGYEFDSLFRQVETFRSNPRPYGYNETSRELIRNIRVIERQFKELTKQKFFVEPTTGEMKAIPDHWDRNRIAWVVEQFGLGVVDNFVKRIRWRVSAGPCILHDEWSPYEYFTVVPFFPYFRRGKTMGVVENLIGSQELLNKVTSQELHVVNTTANSGWKIKTGGLRNMSIEELEQRGAQTGIVLELDDLGSADKIEPNQVPTGLDRISYKAEEHIKSISTVNDTALGDDREDVAAKAIRQKKISQSVNTMKISDNLDRTRHLVGRNVISIVQNFYTAPRVIKYMADELTGETEEIRINEYNAATDKILNDITVGEFEMVITTTPQKDTIGESEFEQAVAMRELGIDVPNEFLIRNSNLRGKGELLRKMKEQAQTPEAQQKNQLVLRAQNAEVENAEAEVDRTKADTLLKSANAQRAKAEADKPPEGAGTPENPGLEMMRMNHEKEQGDADRAHEAQESELDRQLEREKMGHEEAKMASEHAHDQQQTAVQMQHDDQQAQVGRMHDAQMTQVQHDQGVEQARLGHKQQTESSKLQHKFKVTETKVAAKAKPQPKGKKESK